MKNAVESEDARRQFRDHGFVAMRQFLDQDEQAECAENLDRFLRGVLPGLPREHQFYERRDDPATLKQIQQLGEHDAWFADLLHQGKLRGLAELLLEGPVVPKNLQYFNKPPGVGRETPPHQDGYYFMIEPCEAVTMWLALDDVDEENGCVRYVRGSHRRPIREHRRTATLGFSQGISDYPAGDDAANEVAVRAAPGDLLAHHAMTIHRADGNRSRRNRRALGFIYYSERAGEDAAAHAAYQRELADSLKVKGQI